MNKNELELMTNHQEQDIPLAIFLNFFIEEKHKNYHKKSTLFAF